MTATQTHQGGSPERVWPASNSRNHSDALDTRVVARDREIVRVVVIEISNDYRTGKRADVKVLRSLKAPVDSLDEERNGPRCRVHGEDVRDVV